MMKHLTCIECPQGCQLIAEVGKGCLVRVSGYKCPRGEKYAKQEIENPMRTITSTVLTEGLQLKIVPVKTDQPIPKGKIAEAMREIRKVKIKKDVKNGEVIIANILNLNINLISTRSTRRNG